MLTDGAGIGTADPLVMALGKKKKIRYKDVSRALSARNMRNVKDEVLLLAVKSVVFFCQ